MAYVLKQLRLLFPVIMVIEIMFFISIKNNKKYFNLLANLLISNLTDAQNLPLDTIYVTLMSNTYI